MLKKFLLSAVALAFCSVAHADPRADYVSGCVSKAGAPAYTEATNQPCSQDLSGNMRVVLSGGTSGSAVVSTLVAGTSTQSGGTITTHAVFQTAAASSVTRKGCFIQNSSTDVEYIYLGATGSATTANSLQIAPGAVFSCNVPGMVLTDNVAISSKTTDGVTYVLVIQ